MTSAILANATIKGTEANAWNKRQTTKNEITGSSQACQDVMYADFD